MPWIHPARNYPASRVRGVLDPGFLRASAVLASPHQALVVKVGLTNNCLSQPPHARELSDPSFGPPIECLLYPMSPM